MYHDNGGHVSKSFRRASSVDGCGKTLHKFEDHSFRLFIPPTKGWYQKIALRQRAVALIERVWTASCSGLQL